MSVKIEKFILATKGFDEVIDITSKVNDIVSYVSSKEGLVNIFVQSSTASILILEDEPALSSDLAKLLENIVPINKIYQHDNIWHDGNANAHLKSAVLKNSLTLPMTEGKMALGNYQKIVLIDFDNKASNKEIFVTVTY